MVVLSSFIIHVIVDGITYSFGVLFVALLEDFQASKGGTAWILSIFVGMTLGTGEYRVKSNYIKHIKVNNIHDLFYGELIKLSLEWVVYRGSKVSTDGQHYVPMLLIS